MTTQPIIEVHGLSAGYDGRTVLHDIDLTVYENDFLGIIGPNGGGKTTLIKCILGLLKPTAGKITYNISTMGYLPQYNTIDRKFPISVEEVILSGLSSKKSLISRFTDEQREKVRSTIARMGLEGLESRAIGQLSGGQLQRALLGRAIVSGPSVVILDEPSTYIDKRFERFPQGPFLIAERMQVPVVFYFATRERHRTYRFRFFIAGVETGRRRDGSRCFEAFLPLLEEEVRRRNEQWFNFYKFWN